METFDLFLSKWYREISSRYMDLVGDYAGQEFFVVDGEAVLQTIFNDDTLDLGGARGGPVNNTKTYVHTLLTRRLPDVALCISG